MNARLYDPVLGRMLSPDNYVQDISNTQNFNRYSYVLNNPLKYTDPSGDFLLTVVGLTIAAYALSTETVYEFQKTYSPIAFKVDLPFGTHSNGIGFDVSVGTPYSLSPIGYRYNFGATYYANRVGGYGFGWQVRNGGEWSAGYGTFRYGGTRYRNFNNNWDLLDDQVVHTASIGHGRWRLSYTNDTEGSFPWGNFIPLIPNLRTNMTGMPWGWSDRYRTASGNLRVGNFEVGFFLHTGEGTNVDWLTGIGPRQNPNGAEPVRQFVGGNIDDPNRSNGIIYGEYFGLKIGWDSEHIRHLLQNRLAHDGMSSQPQFGNQYPWVAVINEKSPIFVFQFGNF